MDAKSHFRQNRPEAGHPARNLVFIARGKDANPVSTAAAAAEE